MRRAHLLCALVSLGLGGSAFAQVTTVYPTNDGFELPDIGSGGGAYAYANTNGGKGPISVPGWTFIGTNSGLAANGSAFGVSGATNGNHDGTTSTAGQAAFLQGGDGTLTGSAAFDQTLTGLSAGTLSISFGAEQRNCCGGPNNVPPPALNEQVTVYLDGAPVETVLPLTGSFQPFTTVALPVTAGDHTIGFAGLSGTGDTTVFVDNVSVTNTAVPEPASLGVLAIAGAGLLARRRRA